MDKLDMESKNIVSSNIEKIKELFPNVITEDNGKEIINFDALKQELSDVIIDEKKEKYQLTWPGKKQAIVNANSPINKTLRPLKNKSVNFDSTKNIYIEGDNLDALKLLQESYLNKIKCIYIDPPYNTGNDFVYNDKFMHSNNEELIESGRKDENGNILISKDINNNSNGRFHSDWLSMIYSRLKLARNLLTNDGCIFISIDDNELVNLKKVCDEIFGEENFINNICINMSNMSGPKVMHAINGKRFPKIKEYLLIYCKNTDKYHLNIPKEEKKTWDNEYNLIIPEMTENIYEQLLNGENIDFSQFHIYSLNQFFKDNFIEDTIEWKNDNAYRIFASKPNTALLNKAIEMQFHNEIACIKNASGDNKLIKTDFNRDTRTARIELVSAKKNSTMFYGDHWNDIVTTGGIALEGDVPFDNGKKPLKLINRVIDSICDNNDIVLDFFSGSASTAHAVLKNNSINRRKLKFIMVQMPEKCEEETEQYKKGFENICEIGEERIRRAARKIYEETNANIDYGFRVYKIDSSNMKDVFYKPNEIQQANLFDYITNVKEDRTPEDLLTQVILDLGLTLDLSIEEKALGNNKVYYVADNALVACFDDVIDINIIDTICECQPLKVVFKDSSFRTDKDKINLEERVKKASPETKISIL